MFWLAWRESRRETSPLADLSSRQKLRNDIVMAKLRSFIPGLCLLMALSSGCNGQQTPPPFETPASASFALFIETESVGVIPSEPEIARFRFVKVNLALLLDETGQPRNLGANREIVLNLFPDVTYTGVIERMESGDGYSWVGHLKGIEFSELLMIVLGDVFAAHIASPDGVYEVSTAGGDLYQIMMIDQSVFQGE